MAKHRYVTGALFDDEESDVEDSSSFRNRIPPSQLKQTASSYDGCIANDQQKQIPQQKKIEIEQQMLKCASRSIALLRETEDIGKHAANELAHQGEQLQNTNKKLDEIDSNLKIGQKHINGIKSVFYGLKNYISGKSNLSPSKGKVMPKIQSGGLNTKFDDTNNLSQRPGTSENFESHATTHLHTLDLQTSAEPVTSNCQVDDILEANLGEMAHHLTKLKVLGVEFGTQINLQNELIDTIQNKVEVSDIKIGKQNSEMNKILGK